MSYITQKAFIPAGVHTYVCMYLPNLKVFSDIFLNTSNKLTNCGLVTMFIVPTEETITQHKHLNASVLS